MKKIFSLKYFPYYSIFTLIWGLHLALKIQLPYFMISVPFVMGACYIMGASFFYYNTNKQYLLKRKRLQTIIYLYILLYAIATIIKLFIVPSQQDFLRNTVFIMGAMFTVGCLMFIDNIKLLKSIHKYIIKYYPFIFIFIFIPFMNLGSSLVDPLAFYIALFLFLPQKRKWLMPFAILFILVAPGQRMALLRILMTLFFYFLFKYHILRNQIVLNFINTILLISPIVFFTLAATGIFNIFDSKSYMGEITYGNENLTEDTRTFLYQEAIESSIKNNHVIFGRTFGYGYDSFWQTARTEAYGGKKTIHNLAQRNAEVFIINIYTWMGTIGILLFAALFFKASLQAINCANNVYIRYIGVLVSLQWIFCWIENSMTVVNFNQIIMWMEIAICLSPCWRKMTNEEFKITMKNIFKI